jgi:hypothetical protein
MKVKVKEDFSEFFWRIQKKMLILVVFFGVVKSEDDRRD